MDEQKIAPQRQFESLNEFIRRQNNYYGFFTDGSYRRERQCFKRFQEVCPELEKEVTSATNFALRTAEFVEIMPGKFWPEIKLPYEQLWETYKIMSKLVCVDDDGVMRDTLLGEYYPNDGKLHPDPYFLTR